MKEAYVKFETAQLLKEKGFDWELRTYYNEDGDELRLHDDFADMSNSEIGTCDTDYIDYLDIHCTRPTQQMVCRWLREEHNILVTVLPCEVGAGVDDYTYVIYESQPEDYHFKFIEQGRMQPVAYTMDYEGTLEEGIKHVLNNLI